MIAFRTAITPAPLPRRIGFRTPVLALGSCFAETIAGRLAAARFPVTVNPSGVLFNPASVAAAVRRYAAGREIGPGELEQRDGLAFHFDFHGSFAGPDPAAVTARINEAVRQGRAAWEGAEWLFATFGTAWVYTLGEGGPVVANCHREPRSRFVRRRLGVSEIVAEWSALIEGPLAGRELLLTLSPVRHTGDGAEENALSKALLRVAIAELVERYPHRVHYFPAWELLMDDLRDYRFYADDLVHPSAAAAEYVWERFAEAALTPEARQLAARIEALHRALAHRPLHPQSEARRQFVDRMMESCAAIERETGIALTAEKSALAAEFPDKNS